MRSRSRAHNTSYTRSEAPGVAVGDSQPRVSTLITEVPFVRPDQNKKTFLANSYTCTLRHVCTVSKSQDSHLVTLAARNVWERILQMYGSEAGQPPRSLYTKGLPPLCDRSILIMCFEESIPWYIGRGCEQRADGPSYPGRRTLLCTE